MIMKNQIPKSYLPFEIYNNLVHLNDEDQPYYQQIPRTGAFEVSYKGVLVSSKLKEGKWPSASEIVDRCQSVVYQLGDWPTNTSVDKSHLTSKEQLISQKSKDIINKSFDEKKYAEQAIQNLDR